MVLREEEHLGDEEGLVFNDFRQDQANASLKSYEPLSSESLAKFTELFLVCSPVLLHSLAR